jgi:hypothetical protein
MKAQASNVKTNAYSAKTAPLSSKIAAHATALIEERRSAAPPTRRANLRQAQALRSSSNKTDTFLAPRTCRDGEDRRTIGALFFVDAYEESASTGFYFRIAGQRIPRER